MKAKNEEFERSQVRVALLEFMEDYNQNIPETFPRASVALLEKFQTTYPALFKEGKGWSAAEHRKKVMDWLPAFGNMA